WSAISAPPQTRNGGKAGNPPLLRGPLLARSRHRCWTGHRGRRQRLPRHGRGRGGRGRVRHGGRRLVEAASDADTVPARLGEVRLWGARGRGGRARTALLLGIASGCIAFHPTMLVGHRVGDLRPRATAVTQRGGLTRGLAQGPAG